MDDGWAACLLHRIGVSHPHDHRQACRWFVVGEFSRRHLGDKPPADWMDDLDQLVFKGNLLIEEVFFFHKRSRTLIVADFIQNHRTVAGKVFQNTLLKLSGVAYPHGGVPRDIRLTFANRKLARRSLERVLSWDFDRLIIAHGVCIAGEAKRFVKKAFRWLAR